MTILLYLYRAYNIKRNEEYFLSRYSMLLTHSLTHSELRVQQHQLEGRNKDLHLSKHFEVNNARYM